MKSSRKKISTNLPSAVLSEATKLSGLSQTAAIIEGLHELIKREKRLRLINLEGKLKISWNVKASRARP